MVYLPSYACQGSVSELSLSISQNSNNNINSREAHHPPTPMTRLGHDPPTSPRTRVVYEHTSGSYFQNQKENQQDDDNDNELIPYYVSELPEVAPNHKHPSHILPTSQQWRALFLVPTVLVDRIVKHPIVCRGGMFELQPEAVVPSNTSLLEGTRTMFVRAEFVSPFPDELAACMSRRLANRVQQAKYEHECELRRESNEDPSGQRLDSSRLSSMIFGL